MLKKNINKILLCITIISIFTMLIVGCSVNKKDIILSDYIKVVPSGCDGYGSVNIELDYETMINSRANELGLSEEDKDELLRVFDYYTPFKPVFTESTTLKNGDVVMIDWEIDENAKNALAKEMLASFKTDSFEYVVSGLNNIDDFDPFSKLVINTDDAISGKGSINFGIELIINDSKVHWNVVHNGENGKLKNGDVLTLTLAEEIDHDAFARATGKKVSSTTMAYVISEFGEYVYDDSVFHYINSENQKTFDKVIVDWVVSGLNDENVMASQRTYDVVGYILYTNNDKNTPAESISESVLIAIYKITDPVVPGGYYVFIGLEDILSMSSTSGISVNHGQPIPDSFIYYNKETVRYSEKFGWGQDYDGLGFIYDGYVYAGHREIQDTFDYLDSIYSSKYKHKFLSDSFIRK